MKHKISILYSYFIRTIMLLFPNMPAFMRFRGFLYSLLMKNCGKNFQVTSSAIINSLSSFEVGDDVYIAHNTVLIGKNITLGDEVMIGPNCVISSGNHTYLNGSFRFGAHESKSVRIERGAWVGGNCSITAGAQLPECSILASGGVLTKCFTDVESIYAGVPAKKIKSIFN